MRPFLIKSFQKWSKISKVIKIPKVGIAVSRPLIVLILYKTPLYALKIPDFVLKMSANGYILLYKKSENGQFSFSKKSILGVFGLFFIF